MSLKITKEIQDFWFHFTSSNEKFNYLKDYKFEAWNFGTGKKMADELSLLVKSGKKTATCSLLSAYIGHEDELPVVGTYSVLCDGNHLPVAVIYQTATFIEKFSNVSEQFAFDEGEGNRSLGYWKEVHKEFFSKFTTFHEDIELVCEYFKVVYRE